VAARARPGIMAADAVAIAPSWTKRRRFIPMGVFMMEFF
jgi:hypothetical protein